MEDVRYVVKVTKANAQNTRESLTREGIFDATRKVRQDGESLLIPITKLTDFTEHLGKVQVDHAEKVEKTSLSTTLQHLAKEHLGTQWRPELTQDLPNHWEKHDDLVIFPINAFQDPIWSEIKDSEFWTALGHILKAQRLAKKSVISDDDFRSPKITMLLGSDTWATKKENGILYTWNIAKSMFSVGNITEKQRIATFDCEGQTIVDLFAGKLWDDFI